MGFTKFSVFCDDCAAPCGRVVALLVVSKPFQLSLRTRLCFLQPHRAVYDLLLVVYDISMWIICQSLLLIFLLLMVLDRNLLFQYSFPLECILVVNVSFVLSVTF